MKVMQFDFGDANERQKEAIMSTDGPVLITAGPGTGKTFTLVQRAIYLIEECGVKAEEIFIATFTEKAAKELITRITNELAAKNISANINEMYVGTFHSLCLRIIKEHREFTRFKKNYRILDSFDQKYQIFLNLYKFKNISKLEDVIDESGWNLAQKICEYANILSEELVSPEVLCSDENENIVALGKMLELYNAILEEENLIDFPTIQTECFRLLTENPDILEELQNKMKYVMVDEYQDTNYVQEQIIFLLAKKHNNICVVGDDDQGLYRFRGATIRNILEFPLKFGKDECKIVDLVENYRSDSDIVDFYNKWMSTTDGSKFRFDWGRYRHRKTIVPHEQSKILSPCVVKLSSEYGLDEWYQEIYDFIQKLKSSGKLTDYNQLAFLFRSVKNDKVKGLAEFLEFNGVNVYSPRSDMFFDREEIKLVL
ncbi:MAG: ATP-dependent helicase, partial [Methanomicrobium sp.]|nr:ATP-dependent helicase [Methanomicrobium sp.]